MSRRPHVTPRALPDDRLILVATGDRPLVISAYGFDVGVMAQRRLLAPRARAARSERPVVLVEGPHMRQSVIGLGFTAERVRVVPIAVGHERLAYEPPGPPRSPLRLLIAGRFVEKKGIDRPIRTFAALRSSRPDATPSAAVGSRPTCGRWRRTRVRGRPSRSPACSPRDAGLGSAGLSSARPVTDCRERRHRRRRANDHPRRARGGGRSWWAHPMRILPFLIESLGPGLWRTKGASTVSSTRCRAPWSPPIAGRTLPGGRSQVGATP